MILSKLKKYFILVILKRRLICIISISFHFIFAPLYNIYSSHPLFTFSTFYFIYFKVKFEARFNLSTRCYLNFTLLSFQLNDNLLIFIPYYFSFSFHTKIVRRNLFALSFRIAYTFIFFHKRNNPIIQSYARILSLQFNCFKTISIPWSGRNAALHYLI